MSLPSETWAQPRKARLNIKAGGVISPTMPSGCLTVLQTLTCQCLYLWVNIWVRGRTAVPPLKVPLKLCGSLQTVKAYARNFFGPLCWIMTEWERSHGDKREGGRERVSARKGNKWRGRKDGDLNWCYLWVSVMVAIEGHSRYDFLQWQTITVLMGK